MRRLLIANRGEIAVRIARAAGELDIETVAMVPADDTQARHTRAADRTIMLPGAGARAYLDIAAVVAAARSAGCHAVHPGYGFLSERADFARACLDAGLTFVGPSPEALSLFGDKARARTLALRLDVPTPAGSDGPVTLEQAQAFLAGLGPGAAVMIKAVSGGGGRGMREAADAEALADAWDICAAEARGAFGSDALYVERLIARARHVEVQVVGDGESVMTLGERDCSLQRARQKLIEVAPAPDLDPGLRERLFDWSLRLAGATPYRGLATFEFLLDLDRPGEAVFIEANPRLQVEHTVTEAVTGLDLVALQLRLADGASLTDLGLDPASPPTVRGTAVQLRISAEEIGPDGEARPATGRITAFETPGGPGVRIDAGVGTGDAVSPAFDPLVAKLIVHAPDWPHARHRAAKALQALRIEGAPTNIARLQALLANEDLTAYAVDTGWVERLAPVFASPPTAAAASPDGTASVVAPLSGVVAALDVRLGDAVWVGRPVAVLEALKMEHVVQAEHAGVVRALSVGLRDAVAAGAVLLELDPAEVEPPADERDGEADPDAIRPDLAAALARLALTEDAARPEAVARRHVRGGRTARENVADLCDPGSFIEYGALAVAAQRRRRTLEDLQANTPADGIVTGFGSVNGALFPPDKARTAVLAYDYTVLAGTQGYFGHKKTDRVLEEAHAWGAPVVLYAEGGGGRPGDTDPPLVAGLDTKSFAALAQLSGSQPLVGIAHGRCFAGNAALLGCCDVVIATKGSNIGMGGPAMIEGGGLGVFTPEDIGPLEVQRRNGVVDLAVADEAEATAAAKRYLAFFQGPLPDWTAGDPRLLRRLVPENRLRVYAMRAVIDALVDVGSALELRRDFGRAVVTTLARIEGRAVGVLANDPQHLSGAIDGDAADKGARFLRLCEAHGLPVVSLMDTPGFMVGPEVEATAQVRRACRLFVAGAALTVPFMAIVVRKGYGLGAQAMAAGSFGHPAMIAAWPSAKFGGMGLEGAVKLGYRRELEAIDDPTAREARYQELVARQYAHGAATNMAQMLEIDAVIDPANTRALIARQFAGLPKRRAGVPRRPFIDTW